ncbi:MAG: hypothetical protein IJL11_03140 [Synergistaceae bacterium]|nr:hypothetical protein [Synergistaceae bacterium]
MKLKKVAVLLVFVMMFTTCEAAFAYRTGSATGDAVVYGGIGSVIAGGVAYCLAGAATVFCPPVGIAAGLGLLGAGAYGALCEEKTLSKDVFALAIPVGGGVVAVKLPTVAEWTLGIGAGAAVSVPFTKATEAIADEWKKPDSRNPVNVAEIPY